jgi:hypothetical protein
VPEKHQNKEDQDLEKIRNLSDQLFALLERYYELAFDESYPGVRGAPASAAEIQSLEDHAGLKLPDDYRAFLSLHNGWTHFDGDGALLSIADQFSKVASTIKFGWSDTWDAEEPDPFTKPHLLVFGGDALPFFIILDPATPNDHGSASLAEYEYMEIENVYPTFEDFLLFRIEVTEMLIEQQLNGEAEG